MAQIKTLLDKQGNQILPRTRIEAVTLSDGTTSLENHLITFEEGQLIEDLNLDATSLEGHNAAYFTDYTDSAVAALVDSAPSTLNTLNELAAALGDNENYASTITTALSNKAPLSHTHDDRYYTESEIDNLLSGLSSAAEDITISPFGNISSTNVQDALTELDNEKANSATSVQKDNNTGAAYLPVGTTLERPNSPTNGMIRYNTDKKSIEVYHSDINIWSTANTSGQATGGIISYVGGYKVHTFISSDAFIVSSPLLNIEYLIVAGGGGAAGRHSGGGGGGGFITNSASISGGTYPVLIGSGGAGNTSQTVGELGISGSNSSAFGVTALGGGHGGVYRDVGSIAAASGGSGGGGPYNAGAGSGTSGQGYSGGSSYPSTVNGGGGGGANEIGSSGNANGAANGGAGKLSNIDGNSYYYSGGGGGSMWTSTATTSNCIGGNGGIGGGGGGATASTSGTGLPGSAGSSSRNPGGTGSHGLDGQINRGGNGGANTGGGAGGGCQGAYNSYQGYGGNGGSGIVIIRYLV